MRVLKFIFLHFLILNIGLCADYSPQLKTFEELSASPWTDHVNNFAKLFELLEVHSFLEFGLGEGTKFFLDNCDEVTSIELLAKRHGANNDKFYNKCLKIYQGYSNWKPILYHCSNAINNAVDLAVQGINPASVSTAYKTEIKAICDYLFKDKKYDVAFVDAGIHIRGDIVNELFDRVDIIVAHDVGFHPEIYGWAWIKAPPHYVRIRFLEGSGTAFWIKNTRKDVIKGLQKYPGND